MKLFAIVICVALGLVAGQTEIGQKCCQGNQLLDIEQQKCLNDPALPKTQQEESGSSDPLFKCPDGWDTFNTDGLLTGGDLVEPRLNQILKVEQYCVHSVVPQDGQNETMVAYCRPPRVHFKKCCPFGQSVNRTAVGDCVANESFFNASKFLVPKEWPYEVQDNSSLSCKYDYNIYVPKLFFDNRFEIIGATNQLVVKRALYKVLRTSKEYCVDTAVDELGNEEDIAIICLPWRMYLVRYLLFGVYNYLHFISAFFLVLTLAVYSIFPTLRDNIQGYSMICFLICMIVVQIEYGILLSLPREPHTWCFFKTQASNYFRYASSTWITVMGFNIWSQLSRPPSIARTSDLYKRFALCSLYAWGVPLILQMAVIIYRNSLGPPVTLCWFGNPIIKHLLSTPNVVLVTANLVFFIPSALKVYGSLRFLKLSVTPANLSKLEKQRITTIFRFFLLMQFYTIPRIVHEIVDADSASPELLMFSISLYMLIGPAMFYFFVCKTEVFKLITQMTTEVKLSVSRPSTSSGVTKNSFIFWRSRSYETSETKASTSLDLHPVKYNQKGQDNLSFVTEEVPTSLPSIDAGSS